MEQNITLLQEVQLKTMVDSLARWVERDIKLRYEVAIDTQPKGIILVCVMKGSMLFFADLVRKIESQIKLDFVYVSSYENNHKVKEPVVVHNTKYDYKDQLVYIVEDIVDSGDTIHALAQHFTQLDVHTLNLITLFSKKGRDTCRSLGYTNVLIGHHLDEQDFVYGYGLDNNEMERNIPEVRLIIQ